MTTERDWPVATLDPLRRARVLAASWRSAALVETTLDEPYARTWAWISDLPRSVPVFDRDVSGIEITTRERGPDVARRTCVNTPTSGTEGAFSVVGCGLFA